MAPTDYSFNPVGAAQRRPLHGLCRIIDIARVVAFHQWPVIHAVNSISAAAATAFTALSLFHYATRWGEAQ